LQTLYEFIPAQEPIIVGVEAFELTLKVFKVFGLNENSRNQTVNRFLKLVRLEVSLELSIYLLVGLGSNL
jgi:hypothetical protein